MEIRLAQICEVTGAQTSGLLPDSVATGWSIDSRTLIQGDLFLAIKGPNHDGHDHIGVAFAKGAVAALVERVVPNVEGLQLHVPNVLEALQTLARWARRQWARTIVAVTGSAGKTTTKDTIAALLATRMNVGKTAGNLNNHLGLPLSLLRLPFEAEAAVIELGMNHIGEIRALTELAEPQIGVITNVGYAHIEAFASPDDIALAKRELIDELPADGIAVLNADDTRVIRFADVHAGRVVTYGIANEADVRAADVAMKPEGASFRVGDTTFETQMSGRHAILNILAGIAVAGLFDIEPAALVDAVRQLTPGKMRGQRIQRDGMTILNDSYNSNPDAARFMLDVLRDEPARRRVAVLGEMLELGTWAETLHREVGCYAAKVGVDAVIAIRGAARFLSSSARDHGVGESYFFDDSESAGKFLRDYVRPGDALLFKGSRGTQVERALAALES